MDIANLLCLSITMKITIKINIFQIISNASDGTQIYRVIVTHIPTTNIDVAITLDWILRVLSIRSIFSNLVTTYGNRKDNSVYGLIPLYECLVHNNDGVSLAPLVMMNQDKVLIECWYYLKDVF
eukprot:Gb_29118 [translate_table: standard]